MCIMSRMSNSPSFHSLKIHSRFGEDRCLLRRRRGQGRLTIRSLAMRRSFFPWSSAVRTAGWKRRCRGLLVLLQQRRHSLPVKSDKQINQSINRPINQSIDRHIKCAHNTDSVQPPAQNKPSSTYVREKEFTNLGQIKFTPETQPESMQINRKKSILPPTITSLSVLTWRQCRSAWRSTARLGSARFGSHVNQSTQFTEPSLRRLIDWLRASRKSVIRYGLMHRRSDGVSVRSIDWLIDEWLARWLCDFQDDFQFDFLFSLNWLIIGYYM